MNHLGGSSTLPVEARTTFFDNDADWLAAKRKVVGSSEVSALFGAEPAYGLSLWSLWNVKAGKVVPPDKDNNRMSWGRKLEEVIALAYAETNEWKIRKGGFVRHAAVSGMAASLDYVIEDGHELAELDGPGMLEIKNADFIQYRNTWTNDEPPIYTLLQHQHQLACTDARWGAVGVLVGGNTLKEPYVYRRDDKIVAEIERRVQEFWASIEKGEEPPIDGKESTADLVRQMFREADKGSRLDLTNDEEFARQIALYRQGQLQEKAGKAAKDAARNWILHRVGPAETLMSDGVTVATAKTTSRKGYTVEPTSYRDFRIKEGV